MWLHHRTDTRGGEVQIWIADSDGGDKPWSEVETWMQIMCYGMSSGTRKCSDESAFMLTGVHLVGRNLLAASFDDRPGLVIWPAARWQHHPNSTG